VASDVLVSVLFTAAFSAADGIGGISGVVAVPDEQEGELLREYSAVTKGDHWAVPKGSVSPLPLLLPSGDPLDGDVGITVMELGAGAAPLACGRTLPEQCVAIPSQPISYQLLQ
jgi:hypothetical protein